MNINNIPKYTSSYPLQTLFVMNANKVGDNVFKQLKRVGNICLYSRTPIHDEEPRWWEVIITKVVKEGTPLPGGAKVEADYENYPGASSFGLTGWFYNRLSDAEKRFDDLVKKSLTN